MRGSRSKPAMRQSRPSRRMARVASKSRYHLVITSSWEKARLRGLAAGVSRLMSSLPRWPRWSGLPTAACAEPLPTASSLENKSFHVRAGKRHNRIVARKRRGNVRRLTWRVGNRRATGLCLVSTYLHLWKQKLHAPQLSLTSESSPHLSCSSRQGCLRGSPSQARSPTTTHRRFVRPIGWRGCHLF